MTTRASKTPLPIHVASTEMAAQMWEHAAAKLSADAITAALAATRTRAVEVLGEGRPAPLPTQMRQVTVRPPGHRAGRRSMRKFDRGVSGYDVLARTRPDLYQKVVTRTPPANPVVNTFDWKSGRWAALTQPDQVAPFERIDRLNPTQLAAWVDTHTAQRTDLNARADAAKRALIELVHADLTATGYAAIRYRLPGIPESPLTVGKLAGPGARTCDWDLLAELDPDVYEQFVVQGAGTSTPGQIVVEPLDPDVVAEAAELSGRWGR